MGMTEPDPQIIIPKYKKVYDTAMNMLKLFESLLRTTRPFYTLFFEDHQQGFWDIRTFLTQSMAELKKCELSENNDGHVLTAGELTELNSNPIGRVSNKSVFLIRGYIFRYILFLIKCIPQQGCP